MNKELREENFPPKPSSLIPEIDQTDQQRRLELITASDISQLTSPHFIGSTTVCLLKPHYTVLSYDIPQLSLTAVRNKFEVTSLGIYSISRSIIVIVIPRLTRYPGLFQVSHWIPRQARDDGPHEQFESTVLTIHLTYINTRINST